MKKRNSVGAILMAGAILVSLPLGMHRSLSREREKALDNSYYYDSTGYAIFDGLDRQKEAAKNLITVAKRYVDKAPELDPYLDELTYRTEYCENFFDNGSPKEVESYWFLLQAARELTRQLEQTELEEKDRKYPGQLLADIESEQDKLERSSYNDDARAFNQKLEKVPARFLYKLLGIEPLGVFGEPKDWPYTS